MSKYLKHYNETTGEWEIVSSPDVSVIQQLEDGSDITDTNVKVSNYHYTKESGDTTLDEALSEISEDISRLQRNVSWLAEHGGGGSGSGGGTTTSFGIVVNSPVIENGKVYISGTNLKVEFMITGGSEGDICTYAYQFDSDALTDYKPLFVNTPVTLNFELSASTLTSHSLIIRATNPYGNTIAPKSFNIYLSTLSVIFDKDTAGEYYKDGVYNVILNTSHAYIPMIMTNGLEKANIVITAKNGTNFTSIELQSVPAGKSRRQIDFWELVKDPRPNIYYVVTINAESTIGGEKGASSEPFELRIKVINPSEITISVGINGINSDEQISIPAESIISYNFKVYTPSDISRVYYAAKITNRTNSYLILGKYYDENTHEEGATIYSDNDNIASETTISSHYMLNPTMFAENDEPTLSIKVWSFDGSKTKEITKNLIIGKASNDIFPRQIPKRDDASLVGNTMFASWNRNNASETSKAKWVSSINNYDFLSNELKLTETGVTLNMDVINGNDASGIQIENNVPYLRLQNHAYAKIDFSKYAKELAIITNSESSNNQGFTFSISVMADYHTDTKHTVFFWGNNNTDGTLNNGIKIDTNKIYWYIIEKTAGGNIVTHTLSCNFTCKERNSIDFSFTKGNAQVPATARIYVNGVLNAATDLNQIHPSYTLPNEAYIGANFANNAIFNYSDINVYDFSIYTKTLNDFQIVINGKNSRLAGSTIDPEVVSDYSSWKIKNFIKANEDDPSIPESVFFNEEGYQKEFDSVLINNIAQQSSVPTLSLYFSDSSEFTSSYFYSKRTTQDTATTFDCQGTYYDPETQSTVDGMNLKVALQGTSTLGYRIKNLEMYINEMTTVKGVEKVKLFQPKKEWLPESQFTLKADVVDSAHANNAVLGEWINNSGVFENNPAMANFNENTRPQDVDDNGNVHRHIKPGTTEEIDYYEDVSIKHTLEGFPFLLFIKFGGKDASSYYNFIGIYSFNLGRYSYYNMGMKFLKNFSRRSDPEGEKRDACPRLINYYEEIDKLGSINESDVYSFEFGNEGNLQIADYPVWSQYDRTVVETYGDFKYPNAVGDEIWANLCDLFRSTAEFKIDNYYGNVYNGFDSKNYYQCIKVGESTTYVDQGWEIPQGALSYDSLIQHLNINNAAAYFIIANAFGMTDSLGKNLTLRTWDGGNTWWPCFYDMDTALGLTNDGSEDNPVTVAIDKVSMTSDPSTQTTVTTTTYHDGGSKYAAYLSKLWGILRCNSFLYQAGRTTNPYYEEIWNNLRKTNGKLSKASNFTDIMAARIGTCGELIYNYDYNSKYIQNTNEQKGAAAAITFLHGTRINFVRDWLTKHFYFLDGLFDARILPSVPTYEDSPYNSDIFTVTCFYSNTISKIAYNIQVTTPSFIGITIGNDAYEKFYIDEINKDTIVYLNNGTSSNSQITIKGASLISEIDGLQGGFQNISSTNEPGVLNSLNSFNVSNSDKLSSDQPFNENVFLLNQKSPLESINLSNTHGVALSSYKVNLENFDKLLNVDISNSDVTSLSLPKSSLQTLNITNSKITNFSLYNQNIISNLNFTGCNNLNSILLDNCNAIQTLNISEKQNLNELSISDCSGLTSLIISGNPSLTKIEISNCNNLEELIIDNCTNKSLQITMFGNVPSLKKLQISNIESNKTITLPNRAALANVTALTISECYNINGWKYNDDAEMEMYDDEIVYDLSPFTSLDGKNLILNYIESLRYLRVPNDPSKPFNLYRNTLQNLRAINRIFGHIGIWDAALFQGYSKFSLGSSYVPPSNDDTPAFNTSNYATNVTLFITDLSSLFSGTRCDIHDAYYILHVCDENTKNLFALFNGCKEIYASVDNPLNEYIFGKCVNVDNIDQIFNGCDINGIIKREVLEPIAMNLKTFNYVFSGSYGIYPNKENKNMFPSGNTIEEITGFNPIAIDEDSGEEIDFKDIYMLSTLKNVKNIDNSFNDCQIDFVSGGEYDATELFKHNTELISIKDSFNIKYGYGSLGNIFGGYSDDLNYYPRHLSSVTHSFIIKDGDHGNYKLYDEDDGGKLLFPIGNSLFKSIKNSIVYLTGNKASNTTYDFDSPTMSGSFAGNGILKYIPNFNRDRYFDDCNGEGFPYNILKGCTKLKEVPGLFERVHNFKANENGEFEDIVINIPRDIFSDAMDIENISCFFADMGERIKYSLTSEGFKHNHIVNADRLFYNKNIAENSASMVGDIPTKFLYQAVTANTMGQEGITLENAIACGIEINTAYTYSDLSKVTCEIGDEYIVLNDENQENKISKYKAIDITESGETIWEKQEISDEGDVPAGAVITNYTSEKVSVINPTIKTMESAFSGIHSSAVTEYIADINGWEDLVEDNPAYDPILFVVNGGKYRINEHCNIFKKNWNKFVFDNSISFANKVINSGILSEKDEYNNLIVNPSLMPKEFVEGYVKGIQYQYLDRYTIGTDGAYSAMTYDNVYQWQDLIVTNYICAPDIFRYCVSKNANIKNVFSNSSSEISLTNDVFSINGFRGTISSFIFEPLTEISEIVGTFAGCSSIYPAEWHYYLNEVEHIGTMYPADLFANNTSIRNLSSLFEGNRIWGRTVVKTIFDSLPLLYNVSRMWNGAKWLEKDVTGSQYKNSISVQLDSAIFQNNSNLASISGLLGGSYHNSVYTITPIVTPTNNPNLADCGVFMEYAQNSHGAAPELWRWSEFQLASYRRAYYLGDASYLINFTNYVGNEDNFAKFIRE